MVTRRRYAIMTAFLLLLLAAAFFYWHRHRPARPVQLTTNPPLDPVTSAAISPDGQLLAYSDRESVYLKDIASGNTQTLISRKSADAPAEWKISAWFPDGRRFLVNAIAPDGKAHLWIAGTDGDAHLFLENARGWSVSPDGSWVAFARRDSTTDSDQIWLIGAAGQGQHKPFDTPGRNHLTRVLWSRDGKWLTYLRRPVDPLDYNASVDIRGLNGSPARSLVSDPGLSDFFWLPDARVVYSIEQGVGCLVRGIRIDAATGAPRGNPQGIGRWAGPCLQEATVTAKGDRIAYLDGPVKSAVFAMDVDSAGSPLSTAKRLTISEGSDSPDSWLPDNRSVVFQSTRSGPREIYTQGNPGQSAVQLTHELGDKFWPRVTADGAWILYQILPHVFPAGTRAITYAEARPLARIPTAGGAPQTILQERLALSHRCARRVNLCLVSELNAQKDHLIFSTVDFAKGKGHEVATFPADSPENYSWDVSGDGTRIAIAKYGEPQIHIISLSNGAVTDVPVTGWLRHQGFDWASDDQGFFVGTGTSGGTALLHVNLQGEVRTVWRQDGGLRTSGIPSPDGRHLALLGWVRQANVWLIENR